MDQFLCDTPITGNNIAGHLKKAFGPNAILSSIEAKKIGIGEGFASNILHLKLTWKNGNDKNLPETIVVKVPSATTLREVMDDNFSRNEQESQNISDFTSQTVPNLHKRECNFYDMVTGDPPIAMPRCYATVPVTNEGPGMIILEDLSAKASICRSMSGFTLQQTFAAVTEIARFHGWGLTTSVDWRSRVPSFEDNEAVTKGLFEPIPTALEETKRKHPDIFGDIDPEKLAGFIKYESLSRIMTEHRKFFDDTLIHGDFYKLNIMFQMNPDGTLRDQLGAIIDFQGVTKGSPMYDVACLLGCSISSALRREHERAILQHYYDQVKSIAADKFKPTFQEIWYLFKRQLAIESIFLMAWAPTIVIAEKKRDKNATREDEIRFLKDIRAVYDDSISSIC